MILLSILLMTLLVLTLFMIFGIGIGGGIFIILFADVIVCIGAIIWFIKKRITK